MNCSTCFPPEAIDAGCQMQWDPDKNSVTLEEDNLIQALVSMDEDMDFAQENNSVQEFFFSLSVTFCFLFVYVTMLKSSLGIQCLSTDCEQEGGHVIQPLG